MLGLLTNSLKGVVYLLKHANTRDKKEGTRMICGCEKKEDDVNSTEQQTFLSNFLSIS